MACNNCGHGCSNCRHFVTSVSVVDNTAQLVIQIPSNNYLNNSEVCIAIAQNIPGTSQVRPVKIQIGTATDLYDLIDRDGHYVYSDQLRKRTIYCTRVATDSLIFIYNGRCCLPCTSFIMPGSLPVAQATNPTT